MAKDKDRTLNPAAAALKSQKSKSIKKGKAAVAAARGERLAKRDPERLQRRIDELKEMKEAQGGKLKPRDEQALEGLERDVRFIHKARGESKGGDPTSGGAGYGREDSGRRDGGRDGRGGHRGRGGGVLGKRRRDGDEEQRHEDSEDTDPEVRSIPMPRDTPPPIPRPRRQGHQQRGEGGGEQAETNRTPHALPPKPVAQTTYSSAPQLRDLQKEATQKFVPTAVAARLKQRQGLTGGGGSGSGGGEGGAGDKDGGRLLEPEEVDALERGGYLDAQKAADEAAKEEGYSHMARSDGAAGGGALDEEERAFERELEAIEETAADDDQDGDSNDNEGDGREEADTSAVRREEKREMLEEEGREAAEGAAEAAAEEAEHNMMAQEALGSVAEDESRNAQRHLRYVEIEEVEDEDL